MGAVRPARWAGTLRTTVAVLALALAPAAALPALLPAQTWFDALVASVDGDPILASDVTLEDLLYGRGRTFATMDTTQRDEVVTRLVRRRLLLREAERFRVADPTPEAVAAEVARLRERLGDEAEGVDPGAMETQARERLRAEAFVDARIRAFVLIRDAQVAAEIARRTAGAPPNDDKARESMDRQVRQELVARETGERLERYITRLEEHATIRRYPVPDLSF